jgi:hypothetical protein
MASPTHKSRTLREKPDRIGQAPSAPFLATLQETPTQSEPKPDQGSRIAFAVWLLAFAFLGSLLVWDLITAILFR